MKSLVLMDPPRARGIDQLRAKEVRGRAGGVQARGAGYLAGICFLTEGFQDEEEGRTVGGCLGLSRCLLLPRQGALSPCVALPHCIPLLTQAPCREAGMCSLCSRLLSFHDFSVPLGQFTPWLVLLKALLSLLCDSPSLAPPPTHEPGPRPQPGSVSDVLRRSWEFGQHRLNSLSLPGIFLQLISMGSLLTCPLNAMSICHPSGRGGGCPSHQGSLQFEHRGENPYLALCQDHCAVSSGGLLGSPGCASYQC